MRILVISLSLLLSACVTHRGAPPETSSVELPDTSYELLTNQRYTPEDWPESLEADVYRPIGEGPFPAVLTVHGGGWERRTRQDMAGLAEQLAQSGFVAINISYRFAPAYEFPAQLHDLQQAMHWIHANAKQFRIDRDKVSALGYSAGAHLVSLMAVVAGTDSELDQPYGGLVTRPVAVISGGTPSDLRKFTGGTLVPQFLGGTIDEIPEVFAQASPVTHIHKEAPPFFLYHGGSDLLVSDDHARDFYQALRDKDIYAELYILKLHGHIAAYLNSDKAVAEGMRFLQRTDAIR